MRNILVCFANEKYSQSQKRLGASALLYGFDEVRQFSPKDLSASFREKNDGILKQERG